MSRASRATLTPYPSPLTPYPSPLTPYPSPLTLIPLYYLLQRLHRLQLHVAVLVRELVLRLRARHVRYDRRFQRDGGHFAGAQRRAEALTVTRVLQQFGPPVIS